MTKLEKAARSWFSTKRPEHTTEHMHALFPEINCVTGAEKRLAREVAKLILSEKKVPK